ncbi:MAG: hypothetical protein ABJF23_24300 [Bryobacteraceae bacterium]
MNSPKVSPGKKDRPQVNPKTDFNFDTYMDAYEYYRPGTLILYNGVTTKRFTIETHQGDSEILLVDQETVYYRVNRAIWKAHIGASAIESASLVAADPAIRDVHWVFLGPTISTKKP